MAIKAVKAFLAGKRVLYAAPTQEQVDAFWWEVKHSLAEPIDANVFYKNEQSHVIEVPGSKQRIRAKTAWNADTLRGDYADLLILDEWQLINEDAWDLVGVPMLLDNDGDAAFIYTPLSQRSKTSSKARDPLHATKMFKAAQAEMLALGENSRWAAFHFQSSENPHISPEALNELARDMTNLSYRQEILAEDVEDVPGALWTRERIQVHPIPELRRIVIAVDPAVSSEENSDETGIVVGGIDNPIHRVNIIDRVSISDRYELVVYLSHTCQICSNPVGVYVLSQQGQWKEQ